MSINKGQLLARLLEKAMGEQDVARSTPPVTAQTLALLSESSSC